MCILYNRMTSSQTFRQAFNVSKDLLKWYPGHMNKGMVAMQGKLKNIDCVVEVHDARVAISGRNPNFMRNLLSVKPHILVLNKVDLIHKSDIKLIKSNLQQGGIENVIFTNCLRFQTCQGIKKLVPRAIDLIVNSPRYNRAEERDFCMMVIGIPNVGKSSLINALRKKNIQRKDASKVGTNAGITTAVLNRIKVNINPNMYLIDTPGVLPPNIVNEEVALKLALCSCFKDNIISDYVLADFLLYHLNKMGNFIYVDELRLDEPIDEISFILKKIADDYNYYKRLTDVSDHTIKMYPDYDMAARRMVQLFRQGVFGLINLDRNLLS